MRKKSIKIIAAIVCVCFLWQSAGFAADTGYHFVSGNGYLRQAQFGQQATDGQATVTVNANGVAGLQNRRAFEEYTNMAIERIKRHSAQRLALYIIDIDNFKSLNDG